MFYAKKHDERKINCYIYLLWLLSASLILGHDLIIINKITKRKKQESVRTSLRKFPIHLNSCSNENVLWRMSATELKGY